MTFLQEYIDVGQARVPLAATLSLEFGTTSVNIYAGMDDDFKRYNAPILTWYETARYAFERGMVWQNLGGVENLSMVDFIILRKNLIQRLKNTWVNLQCPSSSLSSVKTCS